MLCYYLIKVFKLRFADNIIKLRYLIKSIRDLNYVIRR